MTEYRKASTDDLNMLISTRIEVLRAANMLDDSVDMSLVEKKPAHIINARYRMAHIRHICAQVSDWFKLYQGTSR